MTKKRKAYFGYLKAVKLNSLSAEEKMALFISKKLYTSTRVLNLTLKSPVNLLDSGQFKMVQEPVKELVNAYYCFITKTYQERIKDVFIDFFHSFNNQVYGLKNKEAKRIARSHFMNIINNKNSPNFDIARISDDVGGIPKIDNAPKSELFRMKQEPYKYRLIKECSKGLDEFLMGSSNYFNNGLISKNPVFQEVIQFEGDLKILLALNEEYKFEKSEYGPEVKIKTNNPKITKANALPLLKTKDISLPMPTQEEMDEYILKHVFSAKS